MKLKIQRRESTKGILKKTALYVMDVCVEFDQEETKSLLRLSRELIVFEAELPPQYPISDNQRLPGNLIQLSLQLMEENNDQLACIKLVGEAHSKMHNERWLETFRDRLYELKALLLVNDEMDAKPASEEIEI